MRPFRLGLLAALMAAFLMPAAAMAQKAKKGDAAGAYNAAQLKRGAAEGAAQAQAAGIPCTVSNAAWVGSSPADKKANTPAKDLFEVACGGSMGFIIQSEKGGQTMAFSCLESQSGVPCKLPENANPTALLQAALTKGGAPGKLRLGIGHRSTPNSPSPKAAGKSSRRRRNRCLTCLTSPFKRTPPSRAFSPLRGCSSVG